MCDEAAVPVQTGSYITSVVRMHAISCSYIDLPRVGGHGAIIRDRDQVANFC